MKYSLLGFSVTLSVRLNLLTWENIGSRSKTIEDIYQYHILHVNFWVDSPMTFDLQGQILPLWLKRKS